MGEVRWRSPTGHPAFMLVCRVFFTDPHVVTNDEIAEIKRDYDRDGFVILRGFVQGQEFDELHERAARLSNQLFERQRNGENIHPDGHERSYRMHTGRKTGAGDVLKNLQYHDPWFERQLHAGRHVPLVKTLVEDELVPATAAWFDKHVGSTYEIAPHRDAIGRPQGPHAGATIWIALDPADPDNGCLHYGRGSHRLEFAPGIFVEGFDVDSDSVPATVQPGDAVVHNALTVHWSHGNPTDRPRRAVSFFYRACRTRKSTRSIGWTPGRWAKE